MALGPIDGGVAETTASITVRGASRLACNRCSRAAVSKVRPDRPWMTTVPRAVTMTCGCAVVWSTEDAICCTAPSSCPRLTCTTGSTAFPPESAPSRAIGFLEESWAVETVAGMSSDSPAWPGARRNMRPAARIRKGFAPWTANVRARVA